MGSRLARGNGAYVVYRNSWLTGIATLGFAFVLLQGLLRPTRQGVPWQFVVIAAVVLGIVITWTAVTYRLHGWLVLAVNIVTLGIAVIRIAVPQTTVAFLPTIASFQALGADLNLARDIIRTGVEPVVPHSGILVVIMAVFWGVGALMAWGLMRGHVYVALLPPLVLALQFTTMDRTPTSIATVAVFLILVAAMILSITTDERDATSGRMVRGGEWPGWRSGLAPVARSLLSVTLITALGVVWVFSGVVPRDGALEWRSSTGLSGDFFGSVSYNPFISIHQRLVEASSTPLFTAQIDGDVPAGRVYFQLVTMENFNGTRFYADNPQMVPSDNPPFEDPGHAFSGPQETITADITIANLRQAWLPSVYSTVRVTGDQSLIANFQSRTEDGALLFGGSRSFSGMNYQLTAEIPQPDINVLATTTSGQLSASFQQAAAAAEDVPEVRRVEPRPEPPNVERYLDVPEDADSGIGVIRSEAVRQTRNLTTDFERGLALEKWFHTEFEYKLLTKAELGHGATELAAWLFDTDSNNYRAGYCENFATAMAVMARTLSIPSRVVLGFTPGRSTGVTGQVVVLDSNAHAWVELWMPTQGWVRFDPTPRPLNDTPQTFEILTADLGFDLRAYLSVPDPADVGGPNAPLLPPQLAPDDPAFVGGGGVTDPNRGFGLPSWVAVALRWSLMGVALFGALPTIKWFRRRRRLKRLRSGDITAAWEDIIERLSDLGEDVPAAMTPLEVADRFDPAMRPLATVYGRAFYGQAGTLTDEHVETADRSLGNVTALLQTRYSRVRRLVALYRTGSVMPRRWRRSDSD